MTDECSHAEALDLTEELERLKAHNKTLQSDLKELTSVHTQKLIAAELKAEAYRAGMLDLDGLRLLDTSAVTIDDSGSLGDVRAIMEEFRRSKPWLFSNSNSSNPVVAPRAAPPRSRSAIEMSDEEWRSARSALLKRK